MSRDYIKVIVITGVLISLLGCWFLFRFEIPWSRSVSTSQTAAVRSQDNAVDVEAPKPKVSEPFQEGKHYKRISAKITTHPDVQAFMAENPGKIQVMEFFSYACFWCQRLHPYVNQWLHNKPDNIAFYRFPVVFNYGWDILAKAYYIVEMLGKNETLDPIFFDAIHKDQKNLGNREQLQVFFEQHGVPEQKFLEVFNSFQIQHAFTKGNGIVNAYQIITSPALIVNLPSGSYLITPPMAGSEQAVIQILEYLISRDANT